MKKIWTSLDENTLNSVNPVLHANRTKTTDNTLEDYFDDTTFQSSTSRRDFLKIFGFSIASAAVAASCEQPLRKAIPYLILPEEITPGIASYYASTFFDGQDYCSILVKVRDGRPIKIEGNELSSVTQGGTSARVQASVLNLYDDARYKFPTINNEETSWDNIDNRIVEKLKRISGQGKEITLLTPTIISPATLEVIKEFSNTFPTVHHIQYDAISASGMLEANKKSFGIRAVPSYHFDKAKVIVSFGADFLGTWLAPVEFTRQYARSRSLTNGKKILLKHIHFESGLSLTGSNADIRIPIKTSEEKIILANLYNAVANGTRLNTYPCPESSVATDELAKELIRFHGRSLIVSGSNDPDIQLIVNELNALLANYDHTIDLNNPMLHRKGKDQEMVSFVGSLKNNAPRAVIFYDVNPVYNFPMANELKEELQDCELVVSLTSDRNETAEISDFICPDHHYLESWNDAKIKPGKLSLTQPVIRPIFNTRQAQDSMLKWSGNNMNYYDYLKNHWEKNYYKKSATSNFTAFWNSCVHDGIYESNTVKAIKSVSMPRHNLTEDFGDFPESSEEFELNLYEKVGVGSGKHANNPWLQELPDPVTRAVWDNYLCISPVDASAQDLKTGDLVSLNDKVTLPVLVQPGQTKGTLSAALGYGRTRAGKVAEGVGQNVTGFIQFHKGNRLYSSARISLKKTGGFSPLAQTQTHHSMEGRAIVHGASLNEYLKDPSAGNEMHAEIEKYHTSLYEKQNFPGHHWGMAIDLNKCTGCSACVIACSAENNVPVVGKKEVLRAHEMHWIRIDRYYEGNPDNPNTYRQPVMCQHCDNAPCENVCPVAATNHSDEGLNQMAYNRCIGTRYCNNNCPYKVRRFNWFDYTTADSFKNNTVDPSGMTIDLRRMVLNPDVTVRAKGVIEKCSLCVQRIQEKKLNAKVENRVLKDGEIKTACQQACPAEAIVFGDLNDTESRVSHLFKDPRNYHLLEELHTLPSLGYLTKIYNREDKNENSI